MSVRFAILGLLAQHPRHGYELRAAFEALAGGAESWGVKPAQIYSTLDRLEEAGQVSQESTKQSGGPEKRIYALTPCGREALHAWFENGVPLDHQRDEFFIKLMVALASGEADPHRVIQSQRLELYRELHAATVQRDNLDAQNELAQILLLDKAIMHLEADLRWLDITESRLEEVRSQPIPQPELRPRGRPRKG
jgi:DNA-binding PadR family transcriptional regulator